MKDPNRTLTPGTRLRTPDGVDNGVLVLYPGAVYELISETSWDDLSWWTCKIISLNENMTDKFVALKDGTLIKNSTLVVDGS